MNFERRVITASLRAAGNDYHEPPTLRGYAARFNSLSADLGGFRERIAPGAFTKALQEDHDVRFLFNHNPDAILGRTTSGTLKLSQDDKGLAFECVLPETQTARDVWSSVSRRDIDQCSFAFSSPEDDWDEDEDERGKRFIRRTLRSMNLHDVSCVTYPAYKDTSVNARDNSGLIIVRATIPEHLRYSEDQPRDPSGKFTTGGGSGTGESANTIDEHNKAEEEHYQKYGKEIAAGHKDASAAHLHAAMAHSIAAEEHVKGSPTATKASNVAKKASEKANELSASYAKDRSAALTPTETATLDEVRRRYEDDALFF